MTPEVLLVTWHDAFFDFDSTAEPRADYLVHTVGYVVHDGPRFLSIAAEILPDGEGYRAITHIPVSSIESRTRLSPPRRLALEL